MRSESAIFTFGLCLVLAPVAFAVRSSGEEILVRTGVQRAAPTECDLPPGDPDFDADRAAWELRDLVNIRCSRQHAEDQLANPEFLKRHALNAGPLYLENLRDQVLEPTRPHLNPVFLGPGARVADPFRIAEDWEASGRGQTRQISFIASNGAEIVGRLFAPNAPAPGSLPGVTVTPGLQSYDEVENWLAEGLAEAGYLVLVIDPQGQGRSETFPHNPDGSFACGPGGCSGVSTNTQPETRDAIEYLLSAANPLNPYLDPSRIGIAGHSLGASAVSVIGASDPRVKAVVAFDQLSKVSDALAPGIHAPSLSITGDYPFPLPNGTPNQSPPNPESKSAGFTQVSGRGVDSMVVALRSATHYEYSYLPFPAGTALTTSRYGERIALYYALAWFDRYLKGDASAVYRLTACTFDGSADASSIGQGTWDAVAQINVPYEIEGDRVFNRLSFYYHSKYRLTDGGDVVHEADDLREACR